MTSISSRLLSVNSIATQVRVGVNENDIERWIGRFEPLYKAGGDTTQARGLQNDALNCTLDRVWMKWA